MAVSWSDIYLYAQIASGPAYASTQTECGVLLEQIPNSECTLLSWFPGSDPVPANNQPACLISRPLGAEADELIVAYCGTRNLSDFIWADAYQFDLSWLTNPFLTFIQPYLDPSLFPLATVVPGFLARFNTTRADVWESVSSQVAASQPARVTVTGHSLGGALATYLALVARKLLTPGIMVRLVTFGAPPPVDSILEAYLASQPASAFECDRVASPVDAVPGCTEPLGWLHPCPATSIGSVQRGFPASDAPEPDPPNWWSDWSDRMTAYLWGNIVRSQAISALASFDPFWPHYMATGYLPSVGWLASGEEVSSSYGPFGTRTSGAFDQLPIIGSGPYSNYRLRSLNVWSGGTVNGISTTFVGQDEVPPPGPLSFGKQSETCWTIDLPDGTYLQQIQATFNGELVGSMKLWDSNGTTYPPGDSVMGRDTSGSKVVITAPPGYEIAGFSGNAPEYLTALGWYMRQLPPLTIYPITGADGGTEFDDRPAVTGDVVLRTITAYVSGESFCGLQFGYQPISSSQCFEPPVHGSTTQDWSTVTLDWDEYLQGIQFWSGANEFPGSSGALMLTTSKRTYNFGNPFFMMHILPPPDVAFMAGPGAEIIGIRGRADDSIEALGVITRTLDTLARFIQQQASQNSAALQ